MSLQPSRRVRSRAASPSKAAQFGAQAAREDVRYDCCPFPAGTDQRKRWEAAWRAEMVKRVPAGATTPGLRDVPLCGLPTAFEGKPCEREEGHLGACLAADQRVKV